MSFQDVDKDGFKYSINAELLSVIDTSQVRVVWMEHHSADPTANPVQAVPCSQLPWVDARGLRSTWEKRAGHMRSLGSGTIRNDAHNDERRGTRRGY